MSVTVTPCTSTVTNTATIISTSTVNNFPMKRDGLEVRQQGSCVFTTNSPTSLPAFATKSCTAQGTLHPAFRFSSACSCNGVTAVTMTLPTPTVTVSTTTTTSTTITPTPKAFILQASGLYVTVDGVGALRLTTDATSAVPFYVDNSGQLRNLHNPAKLLVDYYQPSPGTANDKVYNDIPSALNYGITCNYYGRNDGEFWGQCQSSGPADGNPVVYGFGTCPNEGYYVYMIPNNSNVQCADGGYAFMGFFLKAYTGI